MVQDRIQLRQIQRQQDLAAEVETLLHFIAALPRDQRRRYARVNVVEGGPILPPDVEQIAEAGAGEKGRACALAFEDGVCGDGRAVRHLLQRGQAAGSNRFQAGQHGTFRALRIA